MLLKPAILVIVHFLQGCIVHGQTICKRHSTSEWKTQPTVHIVKWSLTQTICFHTYSDCWNTDSDFKRDTVEMIIPTNLQLCPLQLQLGDSLFVSSEPSFQSYGMNLANVSFEEFMRCPQNLPQKQLIFGCRLRGMHQIDPKWLGIGTHYFVETPARGQSLCNLGLRLNITVKQHLCQKSPSAPFCSGRGKCLSHLWDEAYHCFCNQPYTGQFCQHTDLCFSKPCYNNASCISRGEKEENGRDSYECVCPPLFAGRNCSEIIGQCQPHSCHHGNCSNVTPNTHQCQCNKNFSGPFCKEHLAPCNFHPCQNKGLCHNHPSGYRCNCPAGFQGHDCEVDINECSSRPCQNGGTCTDMPNDVVCTCLPMFTGKFCEKIVTICEPPPCLNNGTCIVGVESYHCSCMPGYTGKNCAEVIDYCGLLSINCLNEGLCLSIIEGFRCLCAPGWIGEFCQFIENACLMYSDHCHNGATCVDISPSNLQPQIECLCPQGFTGVYCETEINECDSHPCKHGGSCYDYKGHFKCNCPMGYEGQQCEADIDACLFHNISCSHGAHCIDQPYGLAYICGTACQENTELCANGGRCFHDEDNQGYHCVCLPGWTGPTCLENINDCEVSWCQNGGTCEDGINKYRCLCPPGYSGNFCELIFDPCTGNQCSDYGFCMGNLSDYTCHCNLGYEGPFCEVEANECLSSPCKNGATCLDLIGHFSCQCAAGFKGETCITRVEQCLDKPCRNGATCEEVVNGYKCNCPSGFSGQFCEREANKCDSMPCLNGAVCVDDVNGYDCFCPEGFEGLNCEINFDDCSYSFCKNNSTCLDLVADYACVCPPGFTDKNCSVDIDECAFNLCKNGASCHNLIGKFYCNCLPGFTGRLCETNVGNCLSQPCGSLSLCEDESDGYRCFCAPGFIGDNCETEVDECLSDPCQNGASCVDQLNAFSCLCPDGFQGMLCDINIYECHSNPCLHNATCTDLIGGYNCVCLPGFTGVHCETDIDECASFPCKNGGTCIDQPGNYSCQCVAPFKGFNCEFRPCEGGNPCENGAVCLKEMDLAAFPLGFRCQCVKGFAGPRCEINIDECSSSPCLHGYCYDVVDGFYCLCNPGYAGQKCDQDIDDCIINACKHNSTCVDLHLGYRCSCLSGWEGTFCESESNECDSLPCKNNGTCIDLFNNYRCLCATGWTGQQCGEDINECDPDPCLNGATCYESTTYGQFLCVCAPFYIGRTCQHHYNPCDVPYNPCVNNSTCLAQVDGKPLCICQKGFEGTYCEIDINECISSPCKNQGHCVDRVNSFRCFCRDGFSGTLCEVEINECISNPCANSGTCIDLINRFTCNCAPGYYGSLCELDVNECETLPCLHGGSCFNKPGGYQCACSPGFTGNQCETDIDECLSAPCRNNGSCVDGVNYYKCQCISGYIGTNCETNVDECSSTPCLHGRCVDHVNGYQCICEAGWISSRCEINANECESAPCLNGGSCQDLVNAFECICLNGYTGEFCEVDIDICAEPLLNSSHCFNDGKCVDGPGRTFHCSCPNGFSGPFCEININECGSSPCLHDSVCEDLINGYVCKCQEGWEGIHCEEDINECTPNPCIHGICIQNEPGLGYTCYCQPGFVGRSCELNYNDCLIQACPVGFLCADGINNITCLPVVPGRDQVITQLEGVPPTEPLPGGLTPAWPSLSTSNVYILQTSTDFSYVQYEGDSYMEFEGFQSLPQNNISLEFHTTGLQGVIFYIEQNPATIGQTFIQLSVKDGILQYQFACGSGGEVRNIHTNRQVNDGQKYKVHIRQDLVMCEAEVTILGVTTKASSSSKDWSTFRQQDTGPIFIGGLPYQYTTKQVTEPVYNFTGCIEVTEINNLGPFTLSNAVDKNNIDSCRFPETEERPTAIFGTVPDVPEILPSTLPLPTHPALLSVCQETLCHNGGSCHLIDLPDGAASFQCDCPLHFTGRFCEKDTTLFFPSFSENSYLELPSVTSLAGASFASGQELHRMMIYLTVKTTASKGTLLYVSDEDAGDHFLHLYLVEGRPTARLGCGSQDIVMVTANSSISKNALVPITLSYRLPFGSNGGCCMIEMTTNENSLMRQEVFLMHRLTEVTFGSIFLGNVPPHVKIHPGAGAISGFRGCIREFQVNNKELFVIDEAMGGRNIENCNVPVCDYHPCRNGGTCTSDTENWFCECAALYSGKLCQFSNCEKNPCGNGATCFPKNNQDTVCLCPYGRTGILCHDVINITSPSFSGTDAFGYTSFLAYSTIPNISLYYKFHLKFRLANDNSSLQDNLIFFTGQKGQGLNGDDFLVLGLRNGSVVYSYNLGSGTATIISEPINRTLHVHMVSLGKSLQSGWLKVDDHQNKTVTSPGRLVGLNVFSQFYVGGYIEYIPELLPNGSNFKNGFQGCIFDIQVCTGRDPQCKALGIPEGHPNSGRNVGQCDESPCQLINCKNGGTCVESGSTVYCLCHAGWKGALCTETVSPCDPEHNPPHRCRQGATCIPLPDGYTCHCLLGTTGVYCEQALTISDASFNSNRSSWMAFESFNIRHKVHIQLQFQPLMPDGILFYTAQHLNPRSGDFLSISLVNGYAQLRYNLGDRTIILQTFQDIYFTGSTWHLIKAGRVGNEGYLDFNGINITQKASRGMTALDTHTDFYIGGVPSLNLVNSLAIENEPVGFTGCIREVLVNNRELKLTKRGAKGGSNVGDCDGTPCGYKVCKHHGKCKVENSDFSCLCPKNWIGKTCEQSLYCSHRKCLHGAVCIPNNSLFSYSCACKLGWSGRHCEKQISFFTAKFMGNSYIKYIDPNYKKRDLRFTRVSFNFTTNEMEGLILWLGKAEHEDNDFLAVGLANGTLKVVVNLGERISVPLIHHRKNLCCNTWYYVTITQNRTLIKVYLDEELVVFEDLDPQRKYIALNYGGTCYFGAFGLDGRENTVTSELFKQGLIGKIKDVVLFQDSRKIPLIKGEGYNVYSGDKD